MIYVESLVAALGKRRPIFHSEADLQHELAIEFRRQHPSIACRLEVPLFPEKNASLDLWLRSAEQSFGIEVKYLTMACNTAVDEEQFSLKTQGAHDIRRYDTLKDIQRIEELIFHRKIGSGGVLCVTNDPAYLRGPMRAGTCDEQFALREGQSLGGTMRWSEATGAGTQKGREKPITLAGHYQARWRPFSKIGGHEFWYLWVPVMEPAKSETVVTETAEVETEETRTSEADTPPIAITRRRLSPRVTHASRIIEFLDQGNPPLCDDCLSEKLSIQPRQTVYITCSKLHTQGQVRRDKLACNKCHRTKIVTELAPVSV